MAPKDKGGQTKGKDKKEESGKGDEKKEAKGAKGGTAVKVNQHPFDLWQKVCWFILFVHVIIFLFY